MYSRKLFFFCFVGSTVNWTHGEWKSYCLGRPPIIGWTRPFFQYYKDFSLYRYSKQMYMFITYICMEYITFHVGLETHSCKLYLAMLFIIIHYSYKICWNSCYFASNKASLNKKEIKIYTSNMLAFRKLYVAYNL